MDQGDDVAGWISTYLKDEGIRLMRFPDGFARHTDPAYAKGYQTAYSDGFPILVLSEESLKDLNLRLPEVRAGPGPGSGSGLGQGRARARARVRVRVRAGGGHGPIWGTPRTNG